MRRVLFLLFAGAALAQHVEYQALPEGVLEDHLRMASPKNPERYQRLKELFAQSGCTDTVRREQKVGGSREPNIICDVPAAGEHPRKIIFGAHFDAVGGDGVIDNWSGAVMLPALYDFAKRHARRHEMEFIGFAAEEKGLLGSTAYVKSLAKPERDGIAAVIVLDSLGLTPTKCWVHGSTPELVTDASKLARAMKLDFSGVNVEQVGTTDSAPFKAANIPVLCLHSVTPETWKIINGSRDVLSAVSWNDYYDSHRFVSALLPYLDEILP